jgi:chromosome segregation ATPase
VGSRLYLPVWVTEKETNLMMGPDKSTTITDAKFSYAYWHGKTGEGKVRYGEPGLLLTAEEVARDVSTERDDALAELKSRNAELEALLKEVMATRDEAIRQNDELRKENENLKSDCNDWKDTADDRIVDVQNLTAERDNLKADLTTQKEVNEELKTKIAELTAWYDEANKTATEAAEANDELKAKIADLRNRVGEQLAQIQDLNAEVRFHKEFGEGLDKQQKELQARYDELDSVNKEQAEKIRKLDKALTDLKKRNDDLQAENTNLTFLLEDAPEKETTKTLHVVLNDGTEIEFRRYTAYDYRTDIKMFVVKDGERFIAGFNRGDKSFNFSYWWTE